MCVKYLPFARFCFGDFRHKCYHRWKMYQYDTLQARLPHGSFRLPHVVIPVPVPAPGSRSCLIMVSDDFLGIKIHRKEGEIKAGNPQQKNIKKPS